MPNLIQLGSTVARQKYDCDSDAGAAELSQKWGGGGGRRLGAGMNGGGGGGRCV